jgi:hypothetical protein
MRSDTQSVTLPADHTEVFDFLANPENLPQWAVGFCRSIRPDQDRWLVDTGHGEVPMRYIADPTLGVIDFHFTPALEVEAVARSRVVPNGDGAEYLFTQFQTPGMPDEVFEAQRSTLADELEVLRMLFKARASCPTGK